MDLIKDNSERILAIDFGIKRIGIAISDPLRMFPIPLKTISNDNKKWVEFTKIFNEYNVSLIVLGNPLKEDGSKSTISDKVEEFTKDFNKRFRIKIILVDERYSSAIAMDHILESVPSKKKRRNKALIDMNAAAVILEDYLKSKQ